MANNKKQSVIFQTDSSEGFSDYSENTKPISILLNAPKIRFKDFLGEVSDFNLDEDSETEEENFLLENFQEIEAFHSNKFSDEYDPCYDSQVSTLANSLKKLKNSISPCLNKEAINEKLNKINPSSNFDHKEYNELIFENDKEEDYIQISKINNDLTTNNNFDEFFEFKKIR